MNKVWIKALVVLFRHNNELNCRIYKITWSSYTAWKLKYFYHTKTFGVNIENVLNFLMDWNCPDRWSPDKWISTVFNLGILNKMLIFSAASMHKYVNVYAYTSFLKIWQNNTVYFCQWNVRRINRRNRKHFSSGFYFKHKKVLFKTILL